MDRRKFFGTLFGSVAGAGILWAEMRDTLWARYAESFLDPGDKDVANFRPAPKFETLSFAHDPAIKFLIIGDWGAGGSFQKSIARQMLAKAEVEHPEFILSVGDNIYPDGVYSADDSQWKTKFENIYTGKALELPWYAVLGNHDYRLNPEAQLAYSKKNSRWIMPAKYFSFVKEISAEKKISPEKIIAVEKNSQEKIFHERTSTKENSFNKISAEFFMLDTNILMKNSPEKKTQLAWLDEKLSQSDSRWKIVVGHHMIRSHGVYGDQEFMLRSVKPILDKHGVDFYICGHDHDLQYLKAPEDKFYCVLSGAGGGARKTAYGKNSIFAATNGGFAYMALTDGLAHVQYINRDGKILFADTVKKS